jgi:hypothetical protein
LWKASGSENPSDYEECISQVNNVIALNKYLLLKGSDWFENYYPQTEPVSKEVIFEFFFDDALNQRNRIYGMTQELSYNYDPSQQALDIFANEFTQDASKREPNRGEDKSIAKIGKDNYIIWKFVGQRPDGKSVRSGVEANSANWIIYRLADLYLMKAEALSQLNRYSEAREIINDIRERANVQLLDLPNSASAYEDAILDERALELAFEGKRWFDLLRMGRRNNFKRKSKLIEIIVLNVPSTQKRVLATKLNNPLGWYLPIYDLEIERNRALVQNPYYNF